MSHDNSASLWLSFLETGSQFWKLFSGNWQSVQSLSRVQLFATPWTAIYQASLSITSSQSLLKRMSIKSVMPSNHLILCHPLLLPPPIFHSIKVFSNESVLRIRWSEYWRFSVLTIDLLDTSPFLLGRPC